MLLAFFLGIPCSGARLNDAGQGAPVDVKSVCVSAGDGEVVFAIETHLPFADYRLQEVEEPPVAIGISTRGDRAFEALVYTGARPAPEGMRYVPFGLVTTGPRRPEADFSPFSPRETVAAQAVVRRDAPDTVEVAVPLTALPLRPGRSFRWQLRVVSEGPPGTITFDYAPAASQGLFRLP